MTHKYVKFLVLGLVLLVGALSWTVQADEDGPGRRGNAFDLELQGILNAVNLSALTVTIGNRTAALSPTVSIKVDRQNAEDLFEPVANLANYLGSDVEAKLDSQGLIQTIEIKLAGNSAGGRGPSDEDLRSLKGTLEAVDLNAMVVTVAGQIVPLRADAFVKVDQPGPDRFEALANLSAYIGMAVEVKLDGQGAAVRVEIESDSDDDFRGACTTATGTLEAVNLGTMTIAVAGQTYALTANTYVQLQNAGPDRYEPLESLGNYVGRQVELRVNNQGQVCRIEIQ